MELFFYIGNGMANSVNLSDSSSRSSLIWVYPVCLCNFLRDFSVHTFRTFTVYYGDVRKNNTELSANTP